MPLKSYHGQKEPPQESVLWRFMDLRKFRDLMASEELYFRRSDRYPDKTEGLPPEDYAMRVLGLHPYNVKNRVELNNHLGQLAQHREALYISCWYWFDRGQETLDIWETYGHDGVAVATRYDLLAGALDRFIEETHLGQVQYGTGHLTNRFNGMEFITTKRMKYAQDCEVRAFFACYDLLGSGNRHIDLHNRPHPQPLPLNPRHSWVPDSKRRRIELGKLVTDVVISPWAEPDAVEEITLWAQHKKFRVRRSELTSASAPKLFEFRAHRHLFSARSQELEPAVERCVTKEELDRFTLVLASLTPERVRWLYKERWEIVRLYPGEVPLVSDAQYLEATLRVLDAWRKQGG